jgi:hypothetical protein
MRFPMTQTTMVLSALFAVAPPLHAAPDKPKTTQGAPDLAGLHDFDFLHGDWRVHHRLMRNGQWVEFEGTSNTRPLMDGYGNVEDNALDSPGGAYRAVGLRAFDPKTAQWAIWWLDGRDPFGTLDPPVKGRFENGVGSFYSDYTLNGKPIRVRYLWSHITPTSARWEQAYSSDAGNTWETNWIMEFRRRCVAVK